MFKLIILIQLFLSFWITSILGGENKKPNIIVIMADDLGYQDVGFNGCKDIPTPNIDSIANNGVRFTSAYVSYSVCAPSRAGFITGRYQQRFGFERNPQYKPNDPNMGLTKNEMTIPESLKTVGYTSGIIGKWHLGAHNNHHPLERGFDEFFGHRGGGHKYFCEKLTIAGAENAKSEADSYNTLIERQTKPVKTTGYLTDVFSQEAVDFVERHKKKPFFLFLSYNAPHGPLQATKKYLDRFSKIKDKKRRTYAAMVSAVDDGVGHVLDALDKNNLAQETIIFFLSDNGGPEKHNASNNGNLRGGKSDVWEGGFRVPFAFRWTGHVKPTVYHKPVSSLDIFATIAKVSNGKTNPDKPLDGVNLIPYVTGIKKGVPHEVIYLRKYDQSRFAVRQNDLKIVIPGKDENPQLYNLKTDISETQDIASKQPKDVVRIDSLRKAWAGELVEPTFLGLMHARGKSKSKKKEKKK